MTAAVVLPPFELFTDVDGKPLENGYIYVGKAGLDAETNPENVFWDDDLSVSANNPARTLNGYIVNNGTAANLFVGPSYSITVRNKNGTLVFSDISVNAQPFVGNRYSSHFDTLVEALASTDPSRIWWDTDIGVGARITIGDRGGSQWSVLLTADATVANPDVETSTAFPELSIITVKSHNPTLFEYGGVNDGITDQTAAAAFMASEVGYILMSRGNWLFNTTTIDVPVNYDFGAYTTVPVGQTLTITNKIESTRQFVFRGSGSYLLTNDGDSGEDSRMTHASWFGINPTSDDESTDLSPLITKAYSSFGNLRESIIDFDIGRYHVAGNSAVTRAGWVRGSGTRNTIFVCTGDGYDAFSTLGDGCKFTDFQFEVPLPVVERVSPYIRITKGECEIYRVNMGQSDKGIIVNGNNARIENLLAVYGTVRPADSSLVLIEGGSGNRVSGLTLGTSVARGPEQLVHIGGPTQVSNISNTDVHDINYVTASRAVFIDASDASVSSTNISKIQSNISSGTPANEVIKLFCGGVSTITAVNISGVISSSITPDGIGIECEGGSITDINIDDCVIRGTAGIGVDIVRTGGFIMGITLGETFNARSKPAQIQQTGLSISEINVSPMVYPDVKPAYCYDFTIEDNAFEKISFDRSVFTGVVMVTVATEEQGQFVFRAASVPLVLPMNTASANMATALVPLNGTTGADGKVTLGIVDSEIYIENRLGLSKRINVMILTGI